MLINISATVLDKTSFFSLYFAHRLLWLKLFQPRVILRRTGQAGMSSIALAASRTRAARFPLHTKTSINCADSQSYITQLCTLSNLWWVAVMEKMLTTVAEFALSFLLTKRERELLMAIFWRNLKKSIIKTSGKTMAFPVQCVTLATTELKQCGKRLQSSIRATIFRRGDIPFPL